MSKGLGSKELKQWRPEYQKNREKAERLRRRQRVKRKTEESSRRRAVLYPSEVAEEPTREAEILGFSVVVNTYNRKDMLAKTLSALIPQLKEGDEVIVCDDGSDDGTREMVETRFKGTIYLTQYHRGYRLERSRNNGIAYARNSFIVMLNDDCIPDKGFLEAYRGGVKKGVLLLGGLRFQLKNGNYRKRKFTREPVLAGGFEGGYGGNICFNKQDAEAVGLFTEEYDGYWGYADTDFIIKMRCNGVTLKPVEAAKATHQYHEVDTKFREIGKKRNKDLLKKRYEGYRLKIFMSPPPACAWQRTRYRSGPFERRGEKVAVSVLTLKRPAYLRQCLDSLLYNETPLKIVITNQADYSDEQMEVIKTWKDRPYVHYRVNDPRKWPGPSRAEIFELAKESGFEYIITLDDDCKVLPNAVDKLVAAADKHPEFYAISGFMITPHRGTYMLGGSIELKGNNHVFTNYSYAPGVREADFICNGFRLVRLEPLVVPDRNYTIGLTDIDWAMEVASRGLKMAVCGEAGGHHKYLFVDGKPVAGKNPKDYHSIRRNRSEIQNMRARFEGKWGFRQK